ncbi:MAG: cold shock domain-containing protein [Thermodesulfobacteriota bacterium]|nr:cold shock domain-containing protein [Thermodesulfobacteriota bacterium]
MEKSEDKDLELRRSMQKEKSTMANGIVKWFNSRKGYGFMAQEDGLDNVRPSFSHSCERISHP